jgi:hypothetical protein
MNISPETGLTVSDTQLHDYSISLFAIHDDSCFDSSREGSTTAEELCRWVQLARGG